MHQEPPELLFLLPVSVRSSHAPPKDALTSGLDHSTQVPQSPRGKMSTPGLPVASSQPHLSQADSSWPPPSDRWRASQNPTQTGTPLGSTTAHINMTQASQTEAAAAGSTGTASAKKSPGAIPGVIAAVNMAMGQSMSFRFRVWDSAVVVSALPPGQDSSQQPAQQCRQRQSVWQPYGTSQSKQAAAGGLTTHSSGGARLHAGINWQRCTTGSIVTLPWHVPLRGC